MINARIK